MAINVVGTAVLLVYLAILAIVAMWWTGTSKDLTDFNVAGRTIGPVVLAFTVAATSFSTNTFVGAGGIASSAGYALVWLGPFEAVAVLLMYIIYGDKIRSVSERLDAMTFPQLFSNRFDSPALAIIAGGIITILLVPYTAAILKGGGVLAVTLLDIPYWVAAVGIGVWIALYVGYGGFRTIATTDLIQGVLFTIGLLILIPWAINSAGGMTALTQTVAQEAPAKVQMPGPLGWGGLLGILGVFSIGWWGQPQILFRFMTGERGAHKSSAMWATLVVLFVTTFFPLMGVIAFANYGIVGDQAIPELIWRVLPYPLALLLLVGGIAAARSTVDSIAFMSAQAIGSDIPVDGLGMEIDDEKLHTYSRWLVAGLTLLATVISLNPPEFMFRLVEYVWSAFAGAFIVPTLGLLYWRRLTEVGCASAMVGGTLTAVAWQEAGRPFALHPLYAAIVASLVLLVVVTVLTSKGTDNLPDGAAIGEGEPQPSPEPPAGTEEPQGGRSP